MSSIQFQLLLAVAVVFASCNAFSFDLTRPQDAIGELKLAWSLPSPLSMDSLPSPPSMDAPLWYTVESNVCKGRTVYEDEPMDYKFATPGDDWFTMDETRATETTTTQPRRIINPFRRAARWARRSRQRS
ncbi:expressed unknown protein [Seminavis robusta]|uniref:Uncharacterized protein n=1 Tax=Seminavis robusta TaxID=568900 RepID=A0A9N8HMD1_9STRA|nr:expressed unknown protein [Seminavis robusta]|eukprot:Sro988_g228410.1 n/a (130) ;mRNA; r:24388-24870